MIKQSTATIYLADQRGLHESEKFRTYSTFNYGKYYKDHRQAFGNLYLLNDDSLAAGESLKMQVAESSCLILIPVVGSLSFHDNSGNEKLVSAGEIQVLLTGPGYSFEIINPYETELINFLQIWIKTNERETAIIPDLADAGLEKNKNRLTRILPALMHSPDDFLCQPPIAIGQFNGREEAVYKKNKAGNQLFAFVIEGAFEVEGRLLHARDGLSLSGEEMDIELEALSNDAIIFIVELTRN